MLAEESVNYQLATLALTLYIASAPHKIVFLLLFQLFPACSYVAKNLPVLLWGPLFVEAPVRPNMLNMPKSASVRTTSVETTSGVATTTIETTALPTTTIAETTTIQATTTSIEPTTTLRTTTPRA